MIIIQELLSKADASFIYNSLHVIAIKRARGLLARKASAEKRGFQGITNLLRGSIVRSLEALITIRWPCRIVKVHIECKAGATLTCGHIDAIAKMICNDVVFDSANAHDHCS